MVGWEPFLFAWGGPVNVVKGITETVTVSETRDRVKGIARLSTQSVSVGEATPEVPRVKRGTRTLLQDVFFEPQPPLDSFHVYSFSAVSFTIAYEPVIRTRTANRSLAPETITIGEQSARRKGGSAAISSPVAEPNVVITEALARAATKARLIISTESFEDLSFIASSFEVLDEDHTIISDSVAGQKLGVLARTITETVTISEQVARLETKVRAAVETEAITDLADILSTKARELTEDIPEPDDILTSEVESAALRHTKAIFEDETISDDILSQAEKARTVDETTPILDTLQGWKNNIPLQEEPEVIPDVTNIISGIRERRIRFQEKRPPRFEWQIENTVSAPLRILAFSHDINKLTAEVRLVSVPNTIRIPSLRITSPNIGQIHTPLALLPEPQIAQAKLRLIGEPKSLYASMKVHTILAQQAIEPRKIINIERRYRALKALQLLHMIESLE